jgi:hypothetical protein
MSDQTISMLIGFGIVVGLRLLDWVLPKGYFWKKMKDWSTKDDIEPKD